MAKKKPSKWKNLWDLLAMAKYIFIKYNYNSFATQTILKVKSYKKRDTIVFH